MALFLKLSVSIVAALFLCGSVSAAGDDLSKAVDLYQRGLYSSAMDLLQVHPGAGDDPIVDGYAVLCAQKMHLDGYERRINEYLSDYPSGIIKNEILKEYAYDLFDRKEYAEALKIFLRYPYSEVPKKEKAMFTFKKGYCLYRDGQNGEALLDFMAVDRMEIGNFSAPARYCSGYILYNRGEFERALEWFEKSSVDERFSHISNYYSVICNYQLKRYDKVVQYGLPLFESTDVDPQRKQFLARMISESYLIRGDKEQARRFYFQSGEEGIRSRADYFYAGSLMFAIEDYRSAIENYSHVIDIPDSLGQIALYNTALSNIKIKNKVYAFLAFKAASALNFDMKMKEDAFFNWAKLAFDINRDTSVFAKYLREYSDKVRGELIYSYMALADLSDRDWQSAIDNYDKIDELTEMDRHNYVRANYLRGCQLLDNGSYRTSMPYFQTVAYYTPKNDRLNQLARYNYAMAAYRNEQWSVASESFVALYNSSALFGMRENVNLPYNAAFSFLKQGDYASAGKWFKTYFVQDDAPYRKDAMTRYADCLFVEGMYKEAVAAYTEELDKYYEVNDIYPYYRLSVAKGLAKDKAGKLASLKRVLDASPSAQYYSEAMLELVKAYQENKYMSEAAKTCRKLISESPDTVFKARGLLELGTLKRNAGYPEAAIECYRTVIEKMPSSGLVEDALHAMEALYRAQRKPAKYLAYLESIGRGSEITGEDRQQMVFSAAEQLFYSSDYSGALASFTEFETMFPDSARKTDAEYFIARCHEALGDKVKASDAYHAVFAKNDRLSDVHMKDAAKRYAQINYSLENYTQATVAYRLLLSSEIQSDEALEARVGIMRSLFKSKQYEEVTLACDSVVTKDAALLREVKITKARSLVSLSRRDEAVPVLEELSRMPQTLEGAQASLMLIQHSFDKAEYNDVINRVHAFAQSGTNREYYLARAFIVLGDTYSELGNNSQAKATYNSILEGYSEMNDGVIADVRSRLSKMEGTEL